MRPFLATMSLPKSCHTWNSISRSSPRGTPKIASYDVKFEKDADAYKLTKSAVAEDLDEETATRLTETALAAHRAVKLRALWTHRYAPLTQRAMCT